MPPMPFGAGQHADEQECQRHRDREPFRGAAEDDAERQQDAERREEERGRQRLGASHALLLTMEG